MDNALKFTRVDTFTVKIEHPNSRWLGALVCDSVEWLWLPPPKAGLEGGWTSSVLEAIANELKRLNGYDNFPQQGCQGNCDSTQPRDTEQQ